MESTALVYSSHSRCNYIHNDWIVQRALRGNKCILFLPMSEGEVDGDEYRRQRFSWDNFAWFFSFYKEYGLNAVPFFWNRNLSRSDVDILMDYLLSFEVVILGGGNPWTGMARYRNLGRQFYNTQDAVMMRLRERQSQGLLTVGYSAGADQLCQYMSSCIHMPPGERNGFGLCRNILAVSHFHHGQEDWLRALASDFGHCFVFGIPNDSGIAVAQGTLPSGNLWQVVTMITDKSWDKPEDFDHIKTRQGMKIQHSFPDGRHWAFEGGDCLVRIQSQDCKFNQSFICPPGGAAIDYWSGQTTDLYDINQIIQSFA